MFGERVAAAARVRCTRFPSASCGCCGEGVLPSTSCSVCSSSGHVGDSVPIRHQSMAGRTPTRAYEWPPGAASVRYRTYTGPRDRSKRVSVQTQLRIDGNVSNHLQTEGKAHDLIIWLLIGGLLGWAASVLMGTNGRQGILLNVVVGIVGAFLGGLLLSGFFGASTINEGNFSVNGLVVSFIGAVALLAVVRFFRLAR